MHEPLIIYGIQGTEEWFKYRIGKVTASVVRTLFVRGTKTSEFGSQAHGHAKRLAVERESGHYDMQNFFSKQTERGLLIEKNHARRAYELANFVKITQVSFVDCGTFGCSPDGLIEEEFGGWECKGYSKMEKHYSASTGKMKDHDYQIKFSLFCMKPLGYKWWDYTSFYPEMPPDKKMVINRYYQDDLMNIQFQQKLDTFNILIDQYQHEFRDKGAFA